MANLESTQIPTNVPAEAHGNSSTSTIQATQPKEPGRQRCRVVGSRSASRTRERGRSGHPQSADARTDTGAPHIMAMTSPGSFLVPEDEPVPKRRAASQAPREAAPAEALSNLLMVVKIQQQLAEGAQRQLVFEADVLKRIVEVKMFSIQSVKKLVDESYDRSLHGIEAEFKESERLKNHRV